MTSTLIIAEIGVNHNGDVGLAREMLAAVQESGADIAKLQTYRAEQVMTAATPLAAYMRSPGGPSTFLEMARKLQLPESAITDLIVYADELGIELLSSPFDVPSVQLLAELGFRRIKLPSGELVNPLMLEAAAATGLPLIISTGMADLQEVAWAVQTLQRHQCGPLSLLHCLTQYPAEFTHANLRAMQTMREAFGLPVGFSDHTPGIECAIAAVALGATIIEKHITLDRTLPGPDQAASMTPGEFRSMVDAIRHVEVAMGDGIKRPSPPELPLRDIVRKSLVASHELPAGTVLAKEMLMAKRPGSGIPARHLDTVLGRRLTRTLPADALLMESDLHA